MKRKLISIFLSVLFLVSTLTSCIQINSGANDTTPTESTPAETTPAVTTPAVTTPAETTSNTSNEPSPAEPTKKLQLTFKTPNETKTIDLNNAGEYTLNNPVRVGYEFVGWETEDGKIFPASGKLTENATVVAKWKVLETSTFAQLKERIETGADTILVTDDIVLTETIYVTSNVEITATKPIVLKRSQDFLGDLFVLGETAQGENTILLFGKTASLSLKPQNTALFIDGDNITSNGTAFLLLNSSTLNIYDGVHIQNLKKHGNDHLTVDNDYNVSYPQKVGGAAAIITSGVLNMYGGIISECSASEADSKTVAKEDQIAGYDNSSCGGAIYNYGNFHMYGGCIDNNSAARGGAIYNYRTVKIYAGILQNNYASAYGGVMYMPNSQYTYCVIGSEGSGLDVVIRNNSATASGGAIFASHQSATNILGNTVFESNKSESNGGAINMAGSLTINYAVFKNNSASSKGGAIYAYYGDADFSTRIVTIKSGVFSYNYAPRGGAIAFYGNDEKDPPQGAIGQIGNVTFMNNSANKTSAGKYGNGGAIYAGLSSTVTVSADALFCNNFAGDNKSADTYTTSKATIVIKES